MAQKGVVVVVTTKSDVVRARIDPQTKAEAMAVLDAIGLSLSDAFRLMVTRVAQEKRLPFDPVIPNQTTVDAMMEARRGGLRSVKTVSELMADLDAED